MKRPSFQFYPADWKNNSKLRRCSEAARGAWVDILCLLHDSDEYGVCRWPLDELAHSAGVPLKLAKELVAKDVLKGGDKSAPDYIHIPRHAGVDGDPVKIVDAGEGPCWYSSRLTRDEWLRIRRGAGTRFDSDNQPNKPKQKQPVGDPHTERARLRAKVLEKTGGHCYHCKCHLGETWEIDHFIPRAKGGNNFFSNLVPACVGCNQDKSDTMPDDWVSPTGSPTRPVGERQGDGPTSTSTSSKRKALSDKSDEAEILEYLNAKASRGYRPVKSNLSLIAGRLREGATPDECRAVIDAKVSKWLGDQKMDEYLRPATLFNATNFAQYVGELGGKTTEKQTWE